MNGKRKILVIEDDPDIREDLTRTLILSGYNAEFAENGIEGISKAKQIRPDLIISDIMMPEIDGFEVLKILQENPETNTIPFMFLSAKSARNDIRDGMNLGADDFITKPYDIDELLEAVERRLKKKEVVDAKYNEKFEALSTSLRRSIPHEIRTPLNIILGLAEFLKKNYDFTSHKDAIDMLANIHDSGKRLQRLFENYLYFANLEISTGHQEEIKMLQQKKTPLAEFVIKDIVTYLAGNAGRSNDVEMDLEESGVCVGESHFLKIIEEITDNAFKFSERGTPVKVTTQVIKNMFVISITDFGRGLTREQIESVGAYIQFERKIYEQQGSGLGLTIVRRIIELHKGEFEIISEYGKFTTINVKLPRC